MAKRLTEKQKSEIAEYFKNGKTIEALSEEFNCTISTISRNLKKNLGEIIYKQLLENNHNFHELSTLEEKDIKKKNDPELAKKSSKNEFSNEQTFDVNQIDNNLLQNFSEFIEDPFGT